MIEMPKRSVTRFFIPLIDVLILLFCIFLLLPFVSDSDESKKGAEPGDAAKLQEKLRKAEEQLQVEQRRVQSLMDERSKSAERTLVWIVEIDGDTGRLYHQAEDGKPGERIEMKEVKDARAFIQRTKQKADGRPIKYLGLYPRTKNPSYPDAGTFRKLDEWFAGETFVYENAQSAK